MTSEQQASQSETSTETDSQAPGLFGLFLREHGISSKCLPDSCGVETIEVFGADLLAALKLLGSSPETALNFLVTVSGVDSPDTFDSVYHMWSYINKSELVVKVRLKKAELTDDKLPMVPSAARFWPAANWHERETYDLVGIRYLSHPYPRRILNPWDWEGYPLRRDYKQLIDALNDKSPGSFR